MCLLWWYRRVMRSLGEAGVIEAETEALLIDNDIDFADFPEEVNDCLPQHFPWTIPRVRVCVCACVHARAHMCLISGGGGKKERL